MLHHLTELLHNPQAVATIFLGLWVGCATVLWNSPLLREDWWGARAFYSLVVGCAGAACIVVCTGVLAFLLTLIITGIKP